MHFEFELARRYYGVPQDQFDRRLEAISSIAQDPPAAHSASLYQLVHAHPISSLPAYAALIARSREAADGAGPRPSGYSSLPVACDEAAPLLASMIFFRSGDRLSYFAWFIAKMNTAL